MAFTTASSLLVRLRERADHDAWGRLHALYSPLLHDWCRRYGVPAQDAEDLVQEVFQALVQEMPDFEYDRDKGNFRGWLRTVLVNRLRHYRRSQRFAGQGEFFDRLLDQLADERGGLSDVWNKEHDHHVLSRLLEMIRQEFEEATWAAFHAVAVEGETVSAVAERLGKTPNAVRVAKSRVLARLLQEAELLGLVG